ncbi:kelch domain-containing protein 10 homolog [Microplitis mediator]|uniref:kelch domain-containing protein 10 homolog n=1 Tax=Microplitis mediator TaxID=375433 RepID=UPI0025577B29|nr:kelch domain-containing protein 10 homolog [Microplitis mediator]
MYAFKPHVFTEHSIYSITKPEGKVNEIICCDGKNLYFYGESVTSNSKFYNIREYNLARQQWRLLILTRHQSKSSISDESLRISTIFESNYLVTCTLQTQNTRQRLFNDELSSHTCQLHVCDLNSKSSLVRRTSGQIPYFLFALNFIRHGKYIYTVGIQRDYYKTFSDVYKLNMENDVWEVVYICRGLDANEPVGRTSHTLVYSNNMIYIFGGYDLSPNYDPFSFLKIWAFDLEKCCWKIVDTHGDENHTPQYPTDRDLFGVTSYTDPDSGEMNVIISGEKFYKNEYDNDGEGWEEFFESDHIEFKDVWRLNLTSLKWTCLERFGTALPHQVEDHSITISSAGKLFLFDGVEHEIRTSALHSTWIRIPKLTDICWEAVLHYYPNLKSITDKEIISLGIPLQLFKSRID